MIHQDRKFATYYCFASQIKNLHPEIDSFAAIGTDEDETLSSAFCQYFQIACTYFAAHKCDHIKRKLCELKIKKAAVKQILADIFGGRVDDVYFEGLVDSKSSEEFMEKLGMLKLKWQSLCAGFLEWFMQYKVEAMCPSMIASVCTLAGLGKPHNLTPPMEMNP